MSYSYTIITYGSGEVLTELFNGIAAAVGSDSYMTLMGLVALFGLVWVLMESVFRQNFKLNLYWFVGFFLIYNVLLMPKVTIEIKDRLAKDKIEVVANVPWGLAEFASLASQIGDQLTKLADEAFSLPDDLRYTKTGTVMASSLISTASHFEITDPTFAHNMRQFMQQCVFYDLLLGKYSVSDLFHSSNIWDLISKNPSPARSFPYKDGTQSTIKTCKEGSAKLEEKWTKELKEISQIYGTRFLAHKSKTTEGSEQSEKSKLLLQYLPVSYQHLAKVSESASTIMRQHLLSNAIQNAVIGQGEALESQSMLQGYAFSRSQQMKRTAYQTTGMLAAYWLPIMKNVFEAMFYGSFLFLALFMLLPSGINILKTYIMSLFWLQCWSPLYAVLNLVMTIYAAKGTAAATSTGTGHVLNMMTMSGIEQINADTVALAGYLSISIPFISYGIVKGGAQAFTYLAQYIGGVSQQSAMTSSQEVTTGNLSFGNTQFGNASSFNASSNHTDRNASVQMGIFRSQLSSGAVINHTSSGHDVLDSHTRISSTATSMNLTDSFRHTAGANYHKLWEAGENHVHAYSEAHSVAARNVYELSKSQGHFISSDESWTLHDSAALGKHLNNVHQKVHKYGVANHLSDERAARDLFSGNVGLSGHVGADAMLNARAETEARAGLSAHTGLNPKNLPVAASNKVLPNAVRSVSESVSESESASVFAGVDLHGGVTARLEGISSASRSQRSEAAEEFLKNSQLNESVDFIMNRIHDKHLRSGDDNSQHLIDNISSSSDRMKSESEAATSSFQQAENYQQLESQIKEGSISFGSDEIQHVMDYMKDQPEPGGSVPMGNTRAADILNNDSELARQYIQQYTDQRMPELINHLSSIGHTENDVIEASQLHNQSIATEANIPSQEQTNRGFVTNQAEKYNLGDGHVVKQELAGKVSEFIGDKEERLVQEEQTMNHSFQEGKDKIEHKTNPETYDLKDRAMTGVKKTVKATARETFIDPVKNIFKSDKE